MHELPPLPLRAGQLPMRDLIDLYMSHYTGRDTTRVQRLSWWRGQVGAIALQDLSDDQLHAALDALAQQPSRYWAGKDADGRPIFKAKKRTLAPATINRYTASIGAVITWSIKRRIAPKGFVHPCRAIERQPEHNERTRYLSDEERERLLAVCKASAWSKLYLLILMAITTGARKSELTGLRWGDVDLERAVAHVGQTKNGDPRVLPLVPAVVDELRPIKAGASVLVFASKGQPEQAFAFDSRWREAMKAAKLRGFTFHCLRHSCASMLAQNGATLLEIADVLGHRQLQVTKRYSHLATGHKAALVNRVLGEVR